jgi:acyl carrier protein
MDMNIQSRVRDHVMQRLQMKGDTGEVGDDDSLFASGRLDSLDAVETIIFVEAEYGLEFSEIDFDLTRLDSISAITRLVARQQVPSRGKAPDLKVAEHRGP